MTTLSLDTIAAAAAAGGRGTAPAKTPGHGAPGHGAEGHGAQGHDVVVRDAMAQLWQAAHAHVLDIGAGDGTLARCVYGQPGGGRVTALDITDRGGAGAVPAFDGTTLPFADGAFDAAMLNDVVGRTAPAERIALLRELARTTTGPLYIKGYVVRGAIDRCRVKLLSGDPGLRPPTIAGWRALAAASGWRIAATLRATYRTGLAARIFPNRLEIAMRWER